MNSYKRLQRALGHAVRDLRKERNWSLRDLERLSRVRRGSLSTTEHGGGNPSLTTLEKLAGAFGLTLVEFLREIERRIKS